MYLGKITNTACKVNIGKLIELIERGLVMRIICESDLLETSNLKQKFPTHFKHIILILETIFLFMAWPSFRAVAQEGSGVSSIPQQRSYSLSKDGAAVDFMVSGRMPANARMHVESVERDDEEGNPMLAAYDITLTDGQNQEWQPAYGQPAQVTITDPSFGNGKKLDIFHETEEGREFVATVVSVNNTVTFPAKHFSVYVISTPKGWNRLVVSFVKTKRNYAYDSPDSLLYDTISMLVKRPDTIYNGKFLTRLIYPPNPGYIPPGVNFFGWSRTPDYTADPDSRMTIDVVRQIVYDSLKYGSDRIDFADLGDTLMFYSVLLKSHNISYRSHSNPNVVIGVETVLYLCNDSPEQDYLVNESYIPTETNANFQGWLLAEGDTNIVEGAQPNDIYPNGTLIKIKGNITFVEDLAYGYWLVFNENGKGATYIAPKFLRSNEIEGISGDTLSEAQPDPPTRYGYDFGGWYTDEDVPFLFKGYLNQDTVIHAKWVTKVRATYTIVVWRQNVARDGYDFAESFSLEGLVGHSIKDQAITILPEGDLQYVIVNGRQLGGIKWVPNGQESDPYTGFTLSSVNPIVDQAVTTDGQAVVNIYFDRMKYKLKLYVVRTDAGGNGGYTGTSIGSSTHPEAPYFLGDWSSGKIVSLSSIPRLFGNIPTLYDVDDDNRRYYYYTITAYYGENIRNLWPTHDNITVSGSNFVSWFLMSTAKAFVPGENGTGNGTGGNTLKGEVHIMDEQVLGRLDDSTANLLLARYASTYCPTTFYIYFADVDGTYPDEPSDIVHTRAGQNNYNFLKDKAPSFDGYTYDAGSFTGHNYSTSYELGYHYLRKSYSITFRDGSYRDGDGNQIKNNHTSTPLRVENVIHGSDISGYNNYVPQLPQGEEGYVFEGWYRDEACSLPDTFTTMPMGNYVVYAKWRQKQYRVFMHPQAGTDPSLNWGSESQAMNFRVDYNKKVSAPTGQRDLYEFGGWYLDPECQNRFFSEVTALNDQTVATPYIKKETMTDFMDKWGFIHDSETAFNSDTIVINDNGDSIGKNDRFWITTKLDLYARWRHKLDGAEGVHVEYVCDECVPTTMPRQDTNLYLDKSKMVAAPAPTSANRNKIFAYWVLQCWNPLSGSFVDSLDASGNPVFVYPGGSYTLHLPYAQRNQIEEDSVVYVYRLRAELESFEDNHTFIVWYRNWEGPGNDTVRYDAPDSLTINKMVSIPYPNDSWKREGYIYKGWHKESYGPEGSGQENTFEDIVLGDVSVNFLWYYPDDNGGQYYSKDTTTFPPDSLDFYRASYGVAADEVTPYDYFYAVWEPIQYTIRFHKNTDDLIVTGEMQPQIFKYDEPQDLSKIGFLYKCHKFLGWATSPDGEVVYENQEEILNLTSQDGKIFDLYAKWAEESHDLVVSPDSATCLSPGRIDIQLNGVSMPNYTFSVIELDTTVTPSVTADTVWQHVSSGTHIVAHHIVHGPYRVEVVTGSQCVVYKDTTVFLNPVEVPYDNTIETVCTGSPFVIKPSSNDDVRYLWDAPTKSPGTVVVPDTANNNDPQEYILCTISNSDGSPVSYTIHAILGNCELGDVPTTIDVSTANYPPFNIALSSAKDTFCAGEQVEVTATVNDNIYNNPSYTLKWVFNGAVYSPTVTNNSPTVTQTLTMPSDTCRGDFSVEVSYANVTECHVNAVKNFKVRIKDWEGPERKDSTVHCVKDAVAPHTIEPSIMPIVKDGCGNTLSPIIYDTLVDPVDLSCDGTVTYTYEYEDCDGGEKYWDFVYHVEKHAPEITISSVPAPTPIGTCRYQIPAVEYELTDCDPNLVTVTQTPSANSHILQPNGSDSVITITLTAADKCGDTATVTTTVTIPARPTVTPTAEVPAFCIGGTTPVTAATTGTSSNPLIAWAVEPATGVVTDEDATFSATAPGTYTLTATVVENGCLASNETSVTVKPKAELTITNKNQTLCYGAPISKVYITLQYTNNLETSGFLPEGVNFHADEKVISGYANQSGTFEYYLTASSQDPACGVTKDTVFIKVIELIEGTASITGDTVFCEGKTTTLWAEENAKSYVWANSSGILPNTKSYLKVSEPGVYTVTVTAQDGCVSTGTQEVTKNPRPEAELVLPSVICPEDYRQALSANIISGKSPYTYYWEVDHGASFNETEYQPEPVLTMPRYCDTTYTVTLFLEDSNTCQKKITGTIVMKSAPPTITPNVQSVEVTAEGDCKFYVPDLRNQVTVGTTNCASSLSLSQYCPSEHENGTISSTDNVIITVTDAICNQSVSTMIEVLVPDGMASHEKDSVVLNSFEWEGTTYTESTTVDSTSNDIGNTCRVDRVHFTVLHTNNLNTTICEGETANLVINLERPKQPAVGDVLCLKPTGTANVYDTLILRPDTFVARPTTDGLIPIGVVFYVDPNDAWLIKALALVDASTSTCQWTNIASVSDRNYTNNTVINAAYDTAGYSNTRNILLSAESINNASAPAAYNCSHYDPLTQTSATESTGWYLPAAGEVSMWFAQRLAINKTLDTLKNYLTDNNSSLNSNIPFSDDNDINKGYWTSTDYYIPSLAEFVNQKGQFSQINKTNGKNIRAVFTYHYSASQTNVVCKVGDLIGFKDGSKGVICYVDPDNPYKGWAAALEDLDNSTNNPSSGKFMLQKDKVTQNFPNFILPWDDDGGDDELPNYYTGYGKTEWNVPHGLDNTWFLFNNKSQAADALKNSTKYKLDDGWYIPDMMQLRLWYALFPVIKNTVVNNEGKLPDDNWGTDQGYWSSTGTKKANDFGRMQFPDGKFRSNRGTNNKNLFHIRPVRDFDLSVSWDDKTVASSNPLADTMPVSPNVTTSYTATIEYCGWTLPLTATVTVATQPVITAKPGTEDRDLGCIPATIPAITVNNFTVSDNTNATATVTLTKDTVVNGCEHSRTWTASYQNQCGQAADPVQVTYTWAELSVKADTLSKTYDGEPLFATFSFTPSGINPEVQYKVKNGDDWSAYTTIKPSITDVGTKTYLVEAFSESCSCMVSDTATLTITPKPVTVTAQNKEFTYTGTTQSWPGYDVDGLVGNDAITAEVTGNITFPSESPVPNVVDSYSFTTGTASNYTVSLVPGQLTMVNASEAITITAASQEWTYDGHAHTNNAVTVTEGTLFEGDMLVATATGSATNVADTEEGNNPIAEGFRIMHGTEDVTANYTITPVAGTLTINPKKVTVKAQDEAFVYTGEAQSWAEYDVDGLIGSDAISAVVTGSITFPSESPVTNELTSYTFTAGTAGNYSVTTKNGELTMTNASAAITITAASQTWTYDGNEHQDTTVTVTEGSLFEGDQLVATATGHVTDVMETNTGNNPIAEGYKVMHGEEDVTANYVITPVAGTLTINPKTVTVTAQDKAFTYTGTAQSWPEYDVEGLVGNDALAAVVTGSITFPSEIPVPNVLTSYTFTTGTAGNYSVTTANGQLTMTKASVAITITAASDEWTYDGSAHANSTVTVTSGALFSGDELVATATGSATNVADSEEDNNTIAEGYKVMHGEKDVTENYIITPVAGTLTINPKTVKVTAKSQGFTYDGTAHSNSGYDVEGLVGNDAISAVVTGSITFPSESPVTNTLTSYEFTTGTLGNYTVTTANGSLTMANAAVAITITAASQAWTYDGAAHGNDTVKVTSGSLLTGDSLVATAMGSVTNVAETNTGNNPIAEGFKVMHDEEDVTENYTISTVAGKLTINPKAVTVTANSEEFTYDGTEHSNSGYDVDGLVGSDAISAVVTGSIKFLSESPAVNKVSSYAFTTGTPGNYSVMTVNGQLTMKKASIPITITAASHAWTYDGAMHQDTIVTVTNGVLLTDDYLVAKATGSVTNVTETNTGNNPIEDGYKIMHGYQDVTENYNITKVDGTLTINPKAVTVTAQDEAFVYTGEAQSWPEYDVDGLVGSDALSAVVTGDITFPSESPVTNVLSSYEFTHGTPENYIVTKKNGKLTMTHASVAITITAANHTWTYDGNPHSDSAVTVTSGELLTGDVLVAKATGSVTNVEESTTGNNPIAAGHKVMHGDEDVTANYTIATVAGKLTINPKAVTVTAKSEEFTYDGNVHSNSGYDVDGLVGSDAISAVVTDKITFPSQSPVVNVLRSYEFTTGNPSNYSVTTANGQLTMTNASVAITITAASQSWTYDGAIHQDTIVTVTSGNLLTGDYLVAKATGSVTNVLETSTGNNPIEEGFMVMHGYQDVTANYIITKVDGTLTIKPKPVKVTAQDKAFAYTGTALSWPEYDVIGLLGSDAISAVVTGSIMFPSQSPVTNELTSYEFMTGTPENYSVTMVNGQLTMADVDREITITAASQTWTYDGTPHSNDTVKITSGSLFTGDSLVATATGSVTNVADNAQGNNLIEEGYKVMHGDEDVTANYAITTQAGTLTINPRPVKVTANSPVWTYDGFAHSDSGYVVEGLIGNDSISTVVKGIITFPSQSPVANEVKSYEFTTGTPGNYSVTTVNGQLTMMKASAAITITAANQAWTYDGNPHSDSAVMVTSGELLTGDGLVAKATGSVTNVEDTYTGNNMIEDGFKVMHGYQDVTENYNITKVNGTLTINPKTVTVSANSQEFTYDGTTHSNSGYDVVGLVGNDAISAVVTGSITFPSQNPVTNELTSYTFITGTPENYSVTTTNGELTMADAGRKITITAASQAWTYDGTTHSNDTVKVTSGSLLTGDSLVATATGSVKNVADNVQYNNPIETGYKVMHGEEDVTENYIITAQAGTLTINPKPVTVTANSPVWTYDGTAHSDSGYVVYGLIGNDSISAVAEGIITFPSQSPVTNKLMSYTFTVGDADNYSVTTMNGQLTMMNAAVNITITSASGEWTYDGIAHSDSAVTVTNGSLLSGDKLVAKATGSVTNVEDTDTGNNPIAAGYKVMHGYQDVTANYNITKVNGTLTIIPKTVTVTAKSESFTYDGTAHNNNGYDVIGLIDGDTISAVVTGSITFPSQSPVTNELTSYTFTTGTPDNYNVTTTNGQLTMTTASRAITITAASDEWTYDGTAHHNNAVTVTGGSLLTGDSLVATATGSVTNVEETNTSNNPIEDGYKVMHGNEDVTANYVITTQAGTLTINPKNVTVTAKSQEWTYDGTAHSNSGYDVVGLVGNDNISAVVTGSIMFPSESPVENVLTSYEFTTGTPGNYNVMKTNGELTMVTASRAITITAASDVWTYDGSAHSNNGVTVTDGTLLAGDALIATTMGNVTNVEDTYTGNNPITAGYKIMHGEEDVTENYAITTESGTLTINPKAVKVTARSKAFTYNGAAQSWPEYDVNGLVIGDTISAVVTGSITFPSQSPMTNELTSYQFTSGIPGNYNVTLANGQLTMTHASVPITITTASQSWTYDGHAHTNNAVTVTSGELLAGDELVATATGSVTNVWETATGNNSIAAGYKVMHGEEDVTANYVITPKAGTLAITTRTATVSVEDKEVEYNGSVQNGNTEYTFNNVVGGQTATISYTAANGILASEDPYDNGFYANDFKVMDGDDDVTENYTLGTQNKGKLTIKNRANKYTITVEANSNTDNVYDGIVKSASGFVTLNFNVNGNNYTVSGLTTSDPSSMNVCELTNVVSGTAVVKDAAGNDVTSQFEVNTTNGALTITPRTVTVSVADKTVEYNGGLQYGNSTCLFNNVVNGQTATIGYTPGSGTLASATPYDNGSYDDNFKVMSGTTDVTSNYILTEQIKGNLTINNRTNKYTITVVANSSMDNVYDGTEKSVSGFETLDFNFGGNIFTVSGLTTSDPSSTHACELTNTISGTPVVTDAQGNDVTEQFNVVNWDGVLKVLKRPITVSVDDKVVDYNGNMQYGYTACTFSNVVSGQTATISYTTSSGITASETPYDNGSYSNDFKVTSDETDVTSNYTLTLQIKGTLKINMPPLTVKADTLSMEYDGTPLEATWSYSPFSANPTFLYKTKHSDGQWDDEYTSTIPSITDAGTLTYLVRATANNYSVEDTATLTVTPLSITIKANSATKIYGNTDPSLTAEVTDIPANGVAPVYQLSRASGENVGNYAIIVTAEAASNPNYSVNVENNTFTITQRTVTVSVADTADVEYDGDEHTGNTTYTFDDVLAGQTATITYTPAKGTIVGTYTGSYDNDFKVMSGNTDVTANYHLSTKTPGTLNIVGRDNPYEITVVAKSDTTDNVYTGQPHHVSGFNTLEFTVNGHLYVVEGLSASVSATNAGTYTNAITGTAIVKDVHGHDVTSQFTVNKTEGVLRINPRPVTLISASGEMMYIGTPLTRNEQSHIAVSGDLFVSGEGATYNITGSQTFVGQSPNTFTYTLNQNTLPSNYEITTQFGTLTVTYDTFALSVTSQSYEWYFDGESHKNEKYVVIYKSIPLDTVPGTHGLSFILPYDTLTITPDFGGITHVNQNAEHNNRFTYTLLHDDQYAGKRDTLYGTLKILPVLASVHIKGNRGSETYNGESHTVTGYIVHGIDEEHNLYQLSYFECLGDTVATRTEVGTTPMNLDASDFRNLNTDFNPVHFYVTDGEMVISPVDTVYVLIDGEDSITHYDGNEHSVQGYTVTSISNPLYTTDDFTFTGTAAAARTDVGTTYMGLADTMFHNTNPNFQNVIFRVEDGYQSIEHIHVTVKITGNYGANEYDGTFHSASGYNLNISDSLYQASYITFNGTTSVSRKEKGTTYMELDNSQFVNQNANFHVTFEVVEDGFQTIYPNTSSLTLTCPGGDTIAKKYDGTPLTAIAVATSTIANDEFLIEYSTDGNVWTTTPPSITNYGVLPVTVRCSNSNYQTKTCSYLLSIHKRKVTLTSADSTRMYNGDTLRNNLVLVGGDGFATGEGATYNVTGNLLLVGSSDNTFTYSLNANTSAENYEIDHYFGTLTVTNRPVGNRYPITVTSNSNPVVATNPIIYDGLKHTASDFVTLSFTTTDGHSYTVEGLDAHVSAFDAGEYENIIVGTPVVLDEHGNDLTAQFDIQFKVGKLVIARRPITITIPEEHATMMYNGEPLIVNAENIRVDNLAARDTLTSGFVITEGYVVGTYTCEENNFMAGYEGVASKHNFEITHGASEEYEAGNSLSNYIPIFKVKLSITVRPLELTAASAEKVYDGTTLTMTETDFTVTNGTSIPITDTVIISRSGAQTCVGETAHEINSVQLIHKADEVDVTSNYAISTVDGLLKVTPATTGFSCPSTLNIHLKDGSNDTLISASQLSMATHTLVDAGYATVSNDFSTDPLSVGTYTVTWTLYDLCHTAMTTCEQTVVVDLTPCEGVTYKGYSYGAKRIGHQCWLTENLRNETDAENNAIANFHAYKENPDNTDKFGYLYSWYSAVGVPEGNDATAPQTSIGDDGQPFVQGICPTGWAVPSAEDYNVLQMTVGDVMLLKDAADGYWLPDLGGTLPNSEFNARAGGLYNSALNRYEALLTSYCAWTSDFVPGNSLATGMNISFYCDTALTVQANKAERRSVRCIRKVYNP